MASVPVADAVPNTYCCRACFSAGSWLQVADAFPHLTRKLCLRHRVECMLGHAVDDNAARMLAYAAAHS